MIKLKEIVKEAYIDPDDAGKILDELVKLFKSNKHGDSLKYLFTDRTYRRYAIRAIRSSLL